VDAHKKKTFLSKIFFFSSPFKRS